MNEKCRRAITLSTRFKGGAVHFTIRLSVVRVKVVIENGEQVYCRVELGVDWRFVFIKPQVASSLSANLIMQSPAYSEAPPGF